MPEPTLGPLLHQFARNRAEHEQEFGLVTEADRRRHLIRQHNIAPLAIERELELLVITYPEQYAPDTAMPTLGDVHEWWHDRRRDRIDFGTRLGWAKDHLWPCGCLINDAEAHRVGCPEYPQGRR